MLSVGALRGDGEFGACFSNHGAWVKVYAPGERLTSALTGFEEPVPYVYQHSTYDACRYGFAYACTCQHPRAHRRAERESATRRRPTWRCSRGSRSGAAPPSPPPWSPAWSPPT